MFYFETELPNIVWCLIEHLERQPTEFTPYTDLPTELQADDIVCLANQAGLLIPRGLSDFDFDNRAWRFDRSTLSLKLSVRARTELARRRLQDKPARSTSNEQKVAPRFTAVQKAMALLHQALKNPDAQQFDTKKQLAEAVRCHPGRLSRPRESAFEELWRSYQEQRAAAFPRGHKGHDTGDFDAYADPDGKVERGRRPAKKST